MSKPFVVRYRPGISDMSRLHLLADAISKVRGVIVDVDNIPLDDKRTLESFAKGKTANYWLVPVYPFKKLMKHVKEFTFNDLVVFYVLFTLPEGVESLKEYLARRRRGEEYVPIIPDMSRYADYAEHLLIVYKLSYLEIHYNMKLVRSLKLLVTNTE